MIMPERAAEADAALRLSRYRLLLHFVPDGATHCLDCGMPAECMSTDRDELDLRHYPLQMRVRAHFTDELPRLASEMITCEDLLG